MMEFPVRDRDYRDASLFLSEFFGSTTSQNVEIRALPNERGGGRAAPLFTREPADIEAHCKRWDEIGRAVYFGCCTRLLGRGSGKREDLAEFVGFWADIDCAKLGLDKAAVIERLRTKLFMPPSIIIDSGYGVHAYWLLRESLDIRLELPGAAELEANIVAALRQLAGVVCGDVAVIDLARVMRLPATHNTKRGDMVPCVVLPPGLEGPWTRYEYSEVLDWLDWQRPILEAPRAASDDDKAGAGARARPSESDAFLRYARSAGVKPPIDVGARLAAMEYLGAGDAGIHQTQLHVSASMVRHGADDEAIVALVMAATHEAVGLAGANWNWVREERNVREMIRSARAKFPTPENPGQIAIESQPENESENVKTGSDGEVINLAEQRRARGRPRNDAPGQKAKESLIVKCGDAVIAYWLETRGLLRVVEAQPFTYGGGAWEVWDAGDHHALRSAIQGILRAAKIDPKTQLLNAIYRYVIEHPDLRADGIEWDATGYIICQDAVLKPRDGGGWDVVAHSPEHWATKRIEIRIADMEQGCPQWLAFLDGCFSDRADDEKAAVIASLQEWFGAAMISKKPRELRKAIWLHGESRVGKTRVLEVLRTLVGEPTCSMKLKSLSTHFGPAALIGKRGWIADDAVGASDEVDDAAFKCVVTGEAFSTDVKDNAYATTRFDIPVAFSSNALPRVKDQSDGVFNRSILIPMHVVRSEEETAGKPMIEDVVREGELAGVFAWGLEGWTRLVGRGRFQPPASMREAADAFKAANNPVSTWVGACLVSDSFYMVDRRDLYASFCGWFRAEFGDSKPPVQRPVMIALRQCAKLLPDHNSHGRRYLTGIKLTAEGLLFREDAPRTFAGETRGSGDLPSDVNKPRPGASE